MKIEKVERNFVVKTDFGRIIEAFDTRQEAEDYIDKERIAKLDRFRWWPCLADVEKELQA
ncbi:MAG: hypothetical protein K2H85_01120 [Allobaculum sp.]|nr:hypothetical protein [Allobaculum sp.]